MKISWLAVPKFSMSTISYFNMHRGHLLQSQKRAGVYSRPRKTNVEDVFPPTLSSSEYGSLFPYHDVIDVFASVD